MSDLATWTIRSCTVDDVGSVLALARADEERVSGQPSRLVEGDVRDWWQSVDLGQDSWLFVDASDAPVAVAWLERPHAGLGIGFHIAADPAAVQPAIDRIEARAIEIGQERLQLAVLVPDPAPEELLGARGYREVRRFYEMAIELDEPPSPPLLPAGFTLQPATVEDGPAFHAAIGEAFEDHWEHHPLPFDEWWRRRTSDPDFDIAWWFMVREGDRVVAAVRNVAGRNGGVYVAALGVRRPWRGKGLAKALLTHTFGRAYAAGFPRITLGVDATNPTGATELYRSVGMTSELESAVWEKQLRMP